MTRKVLSAVIWKEGKHFVAKTLALEVASQGKTQKEAIKNLQEAVDLLFESEKVSNSSYCLPQNPTISQVYA